MADGSHLPSRTRETALLDLLHVCRNMRADEIRQSLAFGYARVYDPDETAVSLWKTPGPRLTILGPDGMPIVVGGAWEQSPGVMRGWQVATVDAWDANWRLITKITLKFMDGLFRNGARRLQVTSLVDRVDACHWYEKGLRMRPEGIRRGLGRNGEDAIEFARLRTDP